MHFHAQNLNEDSRGNVKGSILRHGRCWLGRWHAEWKIPSGRLGFSFGGDDEGVLLTISALFFTLYLGYSGLSLRDDREFRIDFFGKAVWFALWHNPMGSWSKDPWWRRDYNFHYVDFLLGRHKRTTAEIETCDVLIPMPEGCYPATVTMERVTVKRPRWFAESYTAADVKVDKGIPFEGKGENSWDCGEDAMYGLYTSAATVEEAVGKAVASVMRDRKRYGTPARLTPVVAA